jgi:hypothetical protein
MAIAVYYSGHRMRDINEAKHFADVYVIERINISKPFFGKTLCLVFIRYKEQLVI